MRFFDDPNLSVYFDAPAVAPSPNEVDQKPVDKAKAAGIVTFSQWLEANYPDVYKSVIYTRPELLMPEFALAGIRRYANGLGEDQPQEKTEPQTDWGTRLISVIEKIVPAYQQQQLFKMQIRRAEQGLPPIDPSSFAPTVNVGVEANTRNLMLFGFIGLGVLFLLARRKG